MELDTSYVARTARRSEQLGRKSVVLKQTIGKTQYSISRLSEELALELATAKETIVSLEEELRLTVQRIESVVRQFSTVVKKGDFARLNTKLDRLAPEQKVTRKQFLELLTDHS